ncbi:MAG: hypothetical protein ACTSSG_13965 [Candidatus Heimdallarchaeaceae archaeon]
MGRQYNFECRDCKLKLTLLDGVGKFSSSPSLNFFCPEYEKISRNRACDICQNELTIEIQIPKMEVAPINKNDRKIFNR